MAAAASNAIGGIAVEIGATDILAFRRVTADRYLALGGFGRGAGWAGCVEFSAADEPTVQAALDAGVATVSCAFPVRIMGPFYACRATLVSCQPDEIVVIAGGADMPAVGE